MPENTAINSNEAHGVACSAFVAAFGPFAWDQALERHWGAAVRLSSVVAPS